MENHSRRQFLSEVGTGMLVAGIGSGLAADLGISTAFANEELAPLTFGSLEPLVDLMQQTSVEKLQPAVVEKIKGGTPLKTLVAAGALANARSFGGQDYIGFHTMMALMPAWAIATELPEQDRPLPILKVFYRNTARMQATGDGERLKKVTPANFTDKLTNSQRLHREMCSANMQSAERTFAALAQGKRADTFNALQYIVQDAPDVHRVTLA